MRVRAFLRNYWPTVMISVTAAAIGYAAIVMFSNMPPHRIVMATGPEVGTYYEVGQRYRAALARENVEVVSRIFRTFGLAERHPALAHAVMAPLI